MDDVLSQVKDILKGVAPKGWGDGAGAPDRVTATSTGEDTRVAVAFHIMHTSAGQEVEIPFCMVVVLDPKRAQCECPNKHAALIMPDGDVTHIEPEQAYKIRRLLAGIAWIKTVHVSKDDE
jgi:hypothetical protein